jgi:hypothetical protein
MDSEELQFRLLIDKDLPRSLPGAMGFGDFDAEEEFPVYTSLPVFFSELALGRPLPLVLVLRDLESVSHLLTVALFLHRDLVIQPAMVGLISAVDLADRWGIAGLAHVDRDLARFLMLLSSFLPSGLKKAILQERLPVAIRWIREYALEGGFPSLPPEEDPPRILNTGTNGFVVASAIGLLETAWVELFRQGFLRGMVFGPPKDDRRRVLIGRKSAFLQMDLPKAGAALNEAERAMGEPPGWRVGTNWVESPEKGTLILVSHLVELLLRV